MVEPAGLSKLLVSLNSSNEATQVKIWLDMGNTQRL